MNNNQDKQLHGIIIQMTALRGRTCRLADAAAAARIWRWSICSLICLMKPHDATNDRGKVQAIMPTLLPGP